jgi:hypothetical protein
MSLSDLDDDNYLSASKAMLSEDESSTCPQGFDDTSNNEAEEASNASLLSSPKGKPRSPVWKYLNDDPEQHLKKLGHCKHCGMQDVTFASLF